jgi:hypothetical protein
LGILEIFLKIFKMLGYSEENPDYSDGNDWNGGNKSADIARAYQRSSIRKLDFVRDAIKIRQTIE